MEEVFIKKEGALIINEKELLIVERYSNGFRAHEIAKELKLSVRTIEAYMVQLKNKFDCTSVTQLSCEFLRKGLIK